MNYPLWFQASKNTKKSSAAIPSITKIAKLLKMLKYVMPTIYSQIKPVVPNENAIISMEMNVKKVDFK